MQVAILGISGSKRKKKRQRVDGRDGVRNIVGGFCEDECLVGNELLDSVGFRAFSQRTGKKETAGRPLHSMKQTSH
jgi:hypothetical protein